MADLLIRGMEMPNNCLDCKIRRDWLTCPILDRYAMNNKTNRHPDCPLAPLPEGHGRLIDADALLRDHPELADCDFIHPKYDLTLRELIEDAPTIVPAEGGTDDV